MKTILNGALIAMIMPAIIMLYFFGYPGEAMCLIMAVACIIFAIVTLIKTWRRK